MQWALGHLIDFDKFYQYNVNFKKYKLEFFLRFHWDELTTLAPEAGISGMDK